MSNVIEAIKKRSSTRGYTAEALTDAQLQALLHAGLQAPTAANKQEIHFTVLKGDHPILAELEAEKNRLRDLTAPEHNFYYEAPIVVILSADSSYKGSPLDAGIAVENMALAAEDLGAEATAGAGMPSGGLAMEFAAEFGDVPKRSA